MPFAGVEGEELGVVVANIEMLVDWINSFNDGRFGEPWRRGVAGVGHPDLVESLLSSFTARSTRILPQDVGRTYILYRM